MKDDGKIQIVLSKLIASQIDGAANTSRWVSHFAKDPGFFINSSVWWISPLSHQVMYIHTFLYSHICTFFDIQNRVSICGKLESGYE